MQKGLEKLPEMTHNNTQLQYTIKFQLVFDEKLDYVNENPVANAAGFFCLEELNKRFLDQTEENVNSVDGNDNNQDNQAQLPHG